MRHPIRSTPSRALKPPAVHATKQKLLETVMAQMTELPLEAITADHVLRHSGVSKGSLYHHYADFSELMEDGLLHEMALNIDQKLAQLELLTQKATSADSFLDGLIDVVAHSQSPDQRQCRFRQARVLAHAENNERLAKRWAVQQQRLTDGYAALLTTCQNKGWFSSQIDPQAAAVFLQALGLGQLVDDGAVASLGPVIWNSTLKQMVRGLFSQP